MRSLIQRIPILSFLLPAGLALGSIIYLIGCLELSFGDASNLEEGFIPYIFGTLFFAGSCLLIFDALRKARKSPANYGKIEKREITDVLLLMGSLFCYIVLLPTLGFSISNIIIILVSAKIMRAKFWSAFLLSVATTVISYIIFIYWLKIPFPSLIFL